MYRIKIILENSEASSDRDPRVCEYDSATLETGLEVYNSLVDFLRKSHVWVSFGSPQIQETVEKEKGRV